MRNIQKLTAGELSPQTHTDQEHTQIVPDVPDSGKWLQLFEYRAFYLINDLTEPDLNEGLHLHSKNKK